MKKSLIPIFSAVGLLVYVRQALFYAQHMGSIIDEGAYLVRGQWFASGTYEMYAPYGPATNHMPLSFLPYGFIQEWFGPGLWEGRVFAVILGAIGLVGLWYLVRQNFGQGWAALAVWAMALNPAIVQMYSQALSQVLVFAMFTWTLALSVGKDRKPWQVVSGAVLAALVYLTRINMAPIYPLLMIYIFWRHGKKLGWQAMVWSLGVLLVSHIWYAPGIFGFEGRILHKFPLRIFDSYSPGITNATNYWAQSASASDRIITTLVTLRAHFLSMLGGLITSFVSLVGFRRIQKRQDFLEFGLIFSLFISLFFVHAYFSMYSSHCIYCLPAYSGFFSFLGVILLIFIFRIFSESKRSWAGAAGVLAVFAFMLWAALYQGSHDAGRTIRAVYNAIPGMQRFNNALGVAAGRLGLPYDIEGGIALTLVLAFGMAAALILLGLHLAAQKESKAFGSPVQNALYIVVIAGLLLTPTRLMGGLPNDDFCGRKTTPSYDAAGEYLAERIPPGSKVIWYTNTSAAPLLHLGEVELFHPTINANYFRYNGGEVDLMNYSGVWNEESALEFAQHADYVLLSDVTNMKYGGENGIGLLMVEAAGVELLDTTDRVIDCRKFSPIYIYGKVE